MLKPIEHLLIIVFFERRHADSLKLNTHTYKTSEVIIYFVNIKTEMRIPKIQMPNINYIDCQHLVMFGNCS